MRRKDRVLPFRAAQLSPLLREITSRPSTVPFLFTPTPKLPFYKLTHPLEAMAGRKRPRGEREGGENDDVEMSDVEDLPPPLSSRRRSHSPSRSPSQSFSTNRQGSATPGPDRRSATPQPDLDAAVKRYEGDFHQDDIDTMLQLTQQFGLTARMVDQIFKCLESLPQFSQEVSLSKDIKLLLYRQTTY